MPGNLNSAGGTGGVGGSGGGNRFAALTHDAGRVAGAADDNHNSLTEERYSHS